MKISASDSNHGFAEPIEACRKNLYVNDEIPYVLSYEISRIRIIMTKTVSLNHLCGSTNVHLHSTYKLGIYKFPVIIIGFSDLDRNFILSAIATSQNENGNTIKWALVQFISVIRAMTSVRMKILLPLMQEQITFAVQSFEFNALGTIHWAHIARFAKYH